jgi:2-hydroxychromene-2-carboxylate isomerase
MDVVQSVADDVGADGCEARAAASRNTYRPAVRADRQRGLDRGVQGTPAVFVNGRQLAQPSYQSLRQAIRSQL